MPNFTSTTSDPVISVSWVDTLTVDVTKIKKSHLVELRTAVSELDGHVHTVARTSYPSVISTTEIPDVSVTYVDSDASILVDQTKVKAQHMNELIGYLKDFDGHHHTLVNYDGQSGTAGQDMNKDTTTYDPTLTFTDDPIVADVTEIKAVHTTELRTYLEGFNIHTHDACCECECQCTCTCQCTGDCGCTCNCTCTCKTC